MMSRSKSKAKAKAKAKAKVKTEDQSNDNEKDTGNVEIYRNTHHADGNTHNHIEHGQDQAQAQNNPMHCVLPLGLNLDFEGLQQQQGLNVSPSGSRDRSSTFGSDFDRELCSGALVEAIDHHHNKLNLQNQGNMDITSVQHPDTDILITTAATVSVSPSPEDEDMCPAAPPSIAPYALSSKQRPLPIDHGLPQLQLQLQKNQNQGGGDDDNKMTMASFPELPSELPPMQYMTYAPSSGCSKNPTQSRTSGTEHAPSGLLSQIFDSAPALTLSHSSSTPSMGSLRMTGTTNHDVAAIPRPTSSSNMATDDNNSQANQKGINMQGPMIHTPPLGSSFENRRSYGKKVRTSESSISGRIRSMSDLEDKGIIDRQQKGVLKDLIISGDNDLQTALDKFEKGDVSHLESMIKNGVLQSKMCEGIDILGDVDLEILRMNGDFGLGIDMEGRTTGNGSLPIPVQKGPNSGNVNLGDNGNLHSMLRLHSDHGKDTNMQNGMRMASQTHLVPPPDTFDGIGDLEFNGEYLAGSESDDFIGLPQALDLSHSASDPSMMAHQPRSQSPGSTTMGGRFRANSLAFDGLLEEPNVDGNQSIGRWMDRTPSISMHESKDVLSSQHPKNSLKTRLPQSCMPAIYGGPDMDPVVLGFPDSMLDPMGPPTPKRKGKQTKKATKMMELLEKKAQKERDIGLKKGGESEKSPVSKLKTEGKKKNKKAGASAKGGGMVPQAGVPPCDQDNGEALKCVASGSGLPRSFSDPNLHVGFDEVGLMHVDRPPHWIGAYSPESRKLRIDRFLLKRNNRVWVKKVKYDVRKNFADSRLRVKGRFVKKGDELLVRDLLSLT